MSTENTEATVAKENTVVGRRYHSVSYRCGLCGIINSSPDVHSGKDFVTSCKHCHEPITVLFENGVAWWRYKNKREGEGND